MGVHGRRQTAESRSQFADCPESSPQRSATTRTSLSSLITIINNGVAKRSLQMVRPAHRRCPGCRCLHIRRQGRLARRHLRPLDRCAGKSSRRGNAFPDSLAAEEHHLRRADKTEEHLHDDWLQGFADGQPDAACAAPSRGPEPAQDLPGTILHLLFFFVDMFANIKGIVLRYGLR